MKKIIYLLLLIGASFQNFAQISYPLNSSIGGSSIANNSGISRFAANHTANLFTVTSTSNPNFTTLAPVANVVQLAGSANTGTYIITGNTIVIPANGEYSIVANVDLNTVGAFSHWGQLVKNNTTVLTSSATHSAAANAGVQVVVNYIGTFVAGDVIDFRISANVAGAIGISGYSINIEQKTGLNTSTGANPSYTQGQIVGLNQTSTSDIGNLIFCNGRLKSTLTPAQQLVATALGYGTNIPDYRGKIPVGADGVTYIANTAGGSNALTIAQANLPSVNLSGGSHAHSITDGGHSHATNINNSTFNGSANGGERFLNNGGSTLNSNITSAFGSTTNTTGISINASGALSIPLGGLGTALTNRPADLPTQYYVWLGASSTAVSVTQALSLTTSGSGISTFNAGTGVLNIPQPDPISKTKALLQGFGVGNNTLLHGMNLASPFYVEVVLRDLSNGSVVPCSIVSVNNTAITINSSGAIISGRLSIIEIKP